MKTAKREILDAKLYRCGEIEKCQNATAMKKIHRHMMAPKSECGAHLATLETLLVEKYLG